MTTPTTGEDTTRQLARIYAAVDYLSDLEGQSNALVVEMSLVMLSDVIEGRGLRPMREYVRRYCDAAENANDADYIADDI